MTAIDFSLHNHLGFHNPYYILKDDHLVLESSFEKSVNLISNEKRVLDYTAVVEVISKGYCFGDRSLIRGINKTPWMAKPNDSYTDWEYFAIPDHMENIDDEQKIAANFYKLLEEELLQYIEPYRNIGILLTGGMDSRVVAAVLKNILEKGNVPEKKIYAYTWGHEMSRDVVYASRISEMYGWEWKHLVVDESQMFENCEIALLNGCEFTPIHLHAMPQVARESHLDCVLAGSFGDSIGRAEFSGRKVSQLTSLGDNIINLGGLLRSDYYDLVKDSIDKDIEEYHRLFPQKLLYQQFEQDQQLHYMRRMLNACMSVINERIPLYQSFSAPTVYAYMWSLNPQVRTDNAYYYILKSKAPELLEIPWARTGLPYPQMQGETDKFKKRHHDYGKMIRDYFLEYVEEALANNVHASVLFNIPSVNTLIKNLKKFPIQGKYVYEEKLLYVGQVLRFIDKFQIDVDLPRKKNKFFMSMKEDIKYKALYMYGKMK